MINVNLQIHGANKDLIVFDMPEDESVRNTILSFLGDCGKACNVELKKIRRSRSTGKYSQNHHLNGHIMQICNELGMCSKGEFEQVKTEVKRIAHMRFGYPAKQLKNGTWIYKSESDCDTEECYFLIESVHLLAADLGIILIETE